MHRQRQAKQTVAIGKRWDGGWADTHGRGGVEVVRVGRMRVGGRQWRDGHEAVEDLVGREGRRRRLLLLLLMVRVLRVGTGEVHGGGEGGGRGRSQSNPPLGRRRILASSSQVSPLSLSGWRLVGPEGHPRSTGVDFGGGYGDGRASMRRERRGDAPGWTWPVAAASGWCASCARRFFRGVRKWPARTDQRSTRGPQNCVPTAPCSTVQHRVQTALGCGSALANLLAGPLVQLL